METETVDFQRFIKGLERLGLNYEDIKKNWEYCGHDKPAGRRIFDNYFKNEAEYPEKETHCICGAAILWNHWITDGESILTIGSICQTNFLKFDTGRRCERCGKTHKNRKDELCNACREIRDMVKCKRCKTPSKTLFCIDCKKYKCNARNCDKVKGDIKYKLCYSCNKSKHERESWDLANKIWLREAN